MPENIIVNNLDKAEGKAALKSYLLKLAEDADVIYTETAPNGSISARRGKLAIYKNGSAYEQWINIDGSTTWQRMVDTSQLTEIQDERTKLCSHFDGADAATAFTDPIAGAYTFVGTAQLDTAQYKFGTASLLLDGNSDYVTLPDSDSWNFGTGDFTIDFQVRFNSTVGTQVLIEKWLPAGQESFLFFFSSNTINIYFNGSSYHSESWTPSTGTWYHMAIVRSGNTLKTYIDGTTLSAGKDCTGLDIVSTTAILEIGAQGPSNYFNGWIDELRISKGIARWTADFTPPTAAYLLAA